MPDAHAENQSAYQKDGVSYLGKIVELFGDYKKRSFEFLQIAPGLSILDVGCGSGEDAFALAQITSGQCEITGVDADQKMLAAANKKKDESPSLPVTFVRGEAGSLPFDDGSFDRCRADRVFQHLAEPEKALAELIRVTRPGGWISVLDVNWSTLLVDAGDDDASRRILDCANGIVPNPAAGTKLYGLFKRAGLADVEAYAETVCIRDWPVARMVCGLDMLAARAADSGAVTKEAADAWLKDLEARDAAGEFFASITGFVVRGKKD